mmetsp:Transcript_23941/g.65243  ORF Transcript_23941/g.65243 Transcript_23941/m.65243 type:complete len:230 (-) Transcript_23941:362-1051(-)
MVSRRRGQRSFMQASSQPAANRKVLPPFKASNTSWHLARRRRRVRRGRLRSGRLRNGAHDDAERGLRAIKQQEVPTAADAVHAAIPPDLQLLRELLRELAAGGAVDVVEDGQDVQAAWQLTRVAPLVERARHPHREVVRRPAARLGGLAPMVYARGVTAEVPGCGDVLQQVQGGRGPRVPLHPPGRDARGRRVRGGEAALQRHEAPKLRWAQVLGQQQPHGAAQRVAND